MNLFGILGGFQWNSVRAGEVNVMRYENVSLYGKGVVGLI